MKMNFDELYEKYKNNTATAEERALVEEEIAKAKKLAAILDEQDAKRVIAPTENETVTKSVKSFLHRTKVRITVIVLAIAILVAGLALGGFFTTAAILAGNNSVCNRDEAVELAKKAVTEFVGTSSDLELRVTEVDRDLVLHRGISKAHYEYEIEIRIYKNGTTREFDVEVNGLNGKTYID